MDPVGVLRRFNRSFTPRIGVLEESFLGSGRPLAAARLLFEIGLADVSVNELRRRLGADSGYLSRLTKNLLDDGLIELRDDPADGRRRIATLTAQGRKAWAELDRRSDEIARSVLSPLDDEQQATLASALATAERLLRLASISLEVVSPDTDDALAAMHAYFDELNQRFLAGFTVSGAFEDEIETMRPPTGGFVVVAESGEARGCGGVHRIDDTTAEIKRMWLHPDLRGMGVGKRLLGRLEALAADLGYDVVVLDTNAVLTEAIAMYHSAGYQPIERYNDNPYAQHWFRKVIG